MTKFNSTQKTLSDRLHSVIPGGAHTYSRGDDQFPSNAPSLLEKGKGAWVWDTDGNKYLDYGMALRANTLGYADDRVNAAAFREIEHGNNLTRASMTELLAAEEFVAQIPHAEMIKFGKNGSNVTTAAVKIARAYTGKKYICVPRQHPFFSFDDWFIGTTQIKKGTLKENYQSTLLFDYGDMSSLEALFDEYGKDIAAVMLEPATSQTPCTDCTMNCYEENNRQCAQKGNNFLSNVQSICNKNGALFILDEMITGFRWHNQGAQTFFGVEPDLSTFGKAMANGFAVAAVVGKREIMEVGAINKPGQERTFLLSTTHGGEMCGLGALRETLSIYNSEDVVGHMWQYGQKLKDGFNAISRTHGLQEHIYVEGPAVALNYVTKNQSGEVDLAFRTLFSQEMVKNGVLMPWISVSYSHGDTELDFTFKALDSAMSTYKSALQNGVSEYLIGHSIKPVFRQKN